MWHGLAGPGRRRRRRTYVKGDGTFVTNQGKKCEASRDESRIWANWLTRRPPTAGKAEHVMPVSINLDAACSCFSDQGSQQAERMTEALSYHIFFVFKGND